MQAQGSQFMNDWFGLCWKNGSAHIGLVYTDHQDLRVLFLITPEK